MADTRETLPAIIAMNEAIRTADPKQVIILVTDGNPSYAAGLHYLNEKRGNDASVAHRKVIGLQNLDSESETYRPYKQLIERLNRTFKHHMRPSHGFNSVNGAVALVTLFVTHYNFLRPHTSLKWQVPIPLKESRGSRPSRVGGRRSSPSRRKDYFSSIVKERRNLLLLYLIAGPGPSKHPARAAPSPVQPLCPAS